MSGTTTIYVSKEQAEATNSAIKAMRIDGWIIEAINVIIPKNGSGCYIEMEGDFSYRFLFQLGMKAGFLLSSPNIQEANEKEKLKAAAPDLLESLKNLFSFAEEIAMKIPSNEFNEQFRDKFNPIMRDAEYAIEKATK